MLSFGFGIFGWYRGVCHRTGSDLLLFLFTDFWSSTPFTIGKHVNKMQQLKIYRVTNKLSFARFGRSTYCLNFKHKKLDKKTKRDRRRWCVKMYMCILCGFSEFPNKQDSKP